MTKEIIGNPDKKKRGRPRGKRARLNDQKLFDHGNTVDDHAFVAERMDRDLIMGYLRSRNQEGKTQLGFTVLRAAAEFPPEQQAEMIELFDKRGARWAKRFMQCQRSPPDCLKIATSVAKFVDREFPGVDTDQIQLALRIVLEGMAEA